MIFLETPCRELQVFLLSGAAHPVKNRMKDRIKMTFFIGIPYPNFVGSNELELQTGSYLATVFHVRLIVVYFS